MPTVRKSARPGLYANIHAKQERIAHGSGEHMRAPGSTGAPSDAAFTAAEKTARRPAAKKRTTKKSSAKKTATRPAAKKTATTAAAKKRSAPRR